jgi:hypothetical protein
VVEPVVASGVCHHPVGKIARVIVVRVDECADSYDSFHRARDSTRHD